MSELQAMFTIVRRQIRPATVVDVLVQGRTVQYRISPDGTLPSSMGHVTRASWHIGATEANEWHTDWVVDLRLNERVQGIEIKVSVPESAQFNAPYRYAGLTDQLRLRSGLRGFVEDNAEALGISLAEWIDSAYIAQAKYRAPAAV